MNYWKQFAEMLGLELEQEFVLTDDDGKRKDVYTYKITEDGVLYKSPTFVNWSVNSLGTVGKLLNGDIKAVPKPWKPKEGDRYCYYSAFTSLVNYARWDDLPGELLLWKCGNCFKTEEEAKTKGKEVMKAIKKEFEEA